MSTDEFPCWCGFFHADYVCDEHERPHVTDGTPCWCDPVIEDFSVSG